MNVDEQSIIEGLRKGEEKAYRCLYDQHYVILCKFANGYLQDPYWAESIVDDVIFHLWEIRDSLFITSSLRGYLLRAVRNSCLNHLKADQNRGEVLLSEMPLESIDFTPEFTSPLSSPLARLLEQELEEKIKQLVDELPKETLAVFKLSRFEHKKNEEIADLLGISVNTVKYHIKKALAFLRENLNHYIAILLIMYLLSL